MAGIKRIKSKMERAIRRCEKKAEIERRVRTTKLRRRVNWINNAAVAVIQKNEEALQKDIEEIVKDIDERNDGEQKGNNLGLKDVILPIVALLLKLGWKRPEEEGKEELLVAKIGEGAHTPRKGTEGSIGLDVKAAAETTVKPNEPTAVSTSIKISVPEGTYARIAPRSGLALKENITVMTGVIDPDYTGEVKVVLKNDSNSDSTKALEQNWANPVFARSLLSQVLRRCLA